MKTDKNIFIAFMLNLAFSVLELFGGIYTGSIAIISDAIHDAGDAASIGLSFFLERTSKKQPDANYTYGYARYSVLGSLISTSVLLLGSVIVICGAVHRMITPAKINYDGMLLFSIIGICVNCCAAFFTHKKQSVNQTAVHLHMFEDVLGWIVVFIGAILIKFTNITYIDPIMSVFVAVFILTNAMKHLKETTDILLDKVPKDIQINEIKKHIEHMDGIADVHHIHIRSLDGQRNFATMHVVACGDPHKIKENIRKKLFDHGIQHVTIELETTEEHCREMQCVIPSTPCKKHHHHH